MDVVGLLEFLSQDSFILAAYALVFLAIILESTPLIGVVIPGGTLALLASGIFLRLGYFSFLNILLISIIAAVLIDNFGYFSGRITKRRTFHRIVGFLFIGKNLLSKLCGLMHDHTGKAIILGRLNPPTRPIAPFMAGMEKVKYSKFLFFSIISSSIWVATFLLIGYIFGESLERVQSLDRIMLWGTIIIIFSIYIAYLLKNYYLKKNGKGRCLDGTYSEK